MYQDDYFSTEIETTIADIDPLYKHIHHASIVEYLEQGRIRFLEAKEVPLEYWHKQDLLSLTGMTGRQRI